MKKLIAISVMLVLLTGAVFAQPSFGGNWKGKFNLMGGVIPDVGDSETRAGQGEVGDAYVNASWAGDKAGGMIRLYASGNGSGGGPYGTGYEPLFTYIYWNIADPVKMYLGSNPDGWWGKANITGWGFNAEAQSGAALDNDTGVGCDYGLRVQGPAKLARETGFYGGWGGQGSMMNLGFEFKPLDILQINLGLGGGGKGGEDGLRDFYLTDTHLTFNVLLDPGSLTVGTILRGFNAADDMKMPDLYASFFLTAIADMAIDIGFAMKGATVGRDEKYENLEVGLGYRGSFGDIGFKLRAGLAMGLDSGNTGFGVQILPSYNAGSFTFFFNAGFGMNMPDVGDSTNEWYINPYIALPANAGTFYVGVQFMGYESKNIAWGIPISWNVYF